MNQPIVISNLLSASSSDLLSGTRLGTAPGDGLMMFEFQADKADATNNFAVTLTLPGGDNPINGVLVPGTPDQVPGILDDRQKLQATYPVKRGGKFQVTLTESGTTVCAYRVTFIGG